MLLETQDLTDIRYLKYHGQRWSFFKRGTKIFNTNNSILLVCLLHCVTKLSKMVLKMN